MSEANLDAKYIQMTQTPVESLICRLAVPTIISNLITTFYNMADTFFIGKISTSASGAVGIAFAVMAAIQAVGFFFGQGSGNNISRLLGRQETDKAERLAYRRSVNSRNRTYFPEAPLHFAGIHGNNPAICHGLSQIYSDRSSLYGGLAGSEQPAPL